MNKPCILIVEADILVRNPLADYLRECGYRVLEASSAHEARQILAETKDDIDAVLADVDGPGENGFGLATWLRTTCPGIQIVLAGTASRAAEKAGELCQEGPATTMPYDHQFVLGQIKRLLAARERRLANA